MQTTKAALQQMIKRANYVALVWKECGSPYPDLPEPTSHGCSQDGERLELVKCGFRGSCTTLSCSCRKPSLKCTEMCGSCESNCENRNAEEVTVKTVDSDDMDLVL